MKIYILKTLQFVFLSILMITFLSSCDNAADSEDEDHAEPFGVAIILNGVEIATQEQGEVTYREGNSIQVPAGDETDLIQFRFISEDGDRFTPHEDEGFGLDWEIGNESILEVEQHDEDGEWAFHFVGGNSGQTVIRFLLLHNNHADFTSLPFDVVVE